MEKIHDQNTWRFGSASTFIHYKKAIASEDSLSLTLICEEEEVELLYVKRMTNHGGVGSQVYLGVRGREFHFISCFFSNQRRDGHHDQDFVYEERNIPILSSY